MNQGGLAFATAQTVVFKSVFCVCLCSGQPSLVEPIQFTVSNPKCTPSTLSALPARPWMSNSEFFVGMVYRIFLRLESVLHPNIYTYIHVIYIYKHTWNSKQPLSNECVSIGWWTKSWLTKIVWKSPFPSISILVVWGMFFICPFNYQSKFVWDLTTDP